MSTPPRRDVSYTSSPERAQRPLELRPLARQVSIDTSKYVLTACSQRDIQIFKLIFEMVNTKGDGMITPLELRKALANYGGYKAHRKLIYNVMACWDIDMSGEISIQEFIRMMTQKPCRHDTIQEIQKAFSQIDKKQKGYISYDDLYQLAQELNQDLTQEEVNEIMKKCDPNREGKITKEAFIAFNKQSMF